MIGRAAIFIAAGLALTACSAASSEADYDPELAGMTEGFISGSASAAAGGASEAGVDALYDPSKYQRKKPAAASGSDSKFVGSYEEVSKLGGMVIKFDASELEQMGVLGSRTSESLILYSDFECEACEAASGWIKDLSVDVVEVPVSFKSAQALIELTEDMCGRLGHESGSEACEGLSEAIRKNSQKLQLYGLTSLPAVSVPSGWTVEGLNSKDSLKGLLR